MMSALEGACPIAIRTQYMGREDGHLDPEVLGIIKPHKVTLELICYVPSNVWCCGWCHLLLIKNKGLGGYTSG